MTNKAANSQLVTICPSCAQWYDQLASYVVQIKEWAAAAASLQTQISMYANMVTQGLSLPGAIFSTVVSDMNTVRNIANQASLLTHESGPIMQRLQTANAYASQAMAFPANITAQFDMWSSTLGNASDKLARVLGVQQGQQLGYAELQAAAQVQSSTAAGQMQAIQAGNELTSLVSTQLNQMQTTITAWAQSDTAHRLVEDDRNARMDAADRMLLNSHHIPQTGYESW